MKGLPPILDRVRLKLKKEDLPPFVIYIRDFSVIPDTDDIVKNVVDDNIPILGVSHWWLEMGEKDVKIGLLIRGRENADFDIKAYSARGGWLDSFQFNPWQPMKSMASMQEPAHTARRLIGGELIKIMHYLWLVENEPARIPATTGVRNAPAAFIRMGDTLRYDRLDSLRTTSGQQREYVPPEEPSGIRKREHEVRGHWRTYRTGVRVWVRSHKRGDPELGRVTRVLCG